MAEVTPRERAQPERAPSAFERWLSRASRVVLATADFVAYLSLLMRRLAQFAG